MATNSSITINFQTTCDAVDGEGLIVVDSDEEMNAGKSCFLYGEKYYFKVYMFPINMVLDLIPTDGSISPEGSGVDIIPITGIVNIDDQAPEYVTFVNTIDANTSKPITTASGQADLNRSSCYWLSQGGRVAAIVDGVSTTIPEPTPIVSGGNILKVSDPIIAVHKVEYPSYFKRYSLILPSRPYDEYPVTVYITGATP